MDNMKIFSSNSSIYNDPTAGEDVALPIFILLFNMWVIFLGRWERVAEKGMEMRKKYTFLLIKCIQQGVGREAWKGIEYEEEN